MKKILVVFIWVLLIAGVGFFVCWSFFQRFRINLTIVPKIQETVEEERPIPVEVTSVTLGEISQTLSLTGEVEASSTVLIKPKVTGRLEELRACEEDGTSIPIEQGTQVSRGQRIGIIDHETFVAQVSQAEAALEVARANLAAVEASLEDAARERARFKNLYQEGAATQQQFDQMDAAYKKAFAAKEVAQAQIRQAEAALQLARINLRESIITSPLTGVVTKKWLDEGNMTSLNTPIVTIQDIKTVKVVVSVPERYLTSIKPKATPVFISVDAYPDETFAAEVFSIYPEIDRETRTAQVEIRLENKSGKLRPGMFVRARFVLRQRENTIVVPGDSVFKQAEERFVFLVNEGRAPYGRARKVPVKVGLVEGPKIEIVSGLRVGDLLVTTGMDYLRDGSEVDIVQGSVK